MGSCLSGSAGKPKHHTMSKGQSTETGKLPKAYPEQQQQQQQKVGDKIGNQIVKEYYTLKKTEQRCTGLFWREDPRPNTPRLSSGDNWPRDYAKLKGEIIIDPYNEEWLLVSHIMQPNESTWKTAPIGATIAFEEDQYYLE